MHSVNILIEKIGQKKECQYYSENNLMKLRSIYFPLSYLNKLYFHYYNNLIYEEEEACF